MGILDIDTLFANILFEETIEICTNNLFKNSDTVHGLKTSEFKDLLSLAAKGSYFIFNNILHKKIVFSSMGSPNLGNPFKLLWN